MTSADRRQQKFFEWIAALEERHLSDLTPAEVARALRALSSCYVERRGKLSEGGALAGAGKRAAFALYYGPLHCLVVREVVRALELPRMAEVVDLGCGTGAAGAGWALEAGASRVAGFDRHPWAVAEARWTYRQFGLSGSATRADIAGLRFRVRRGLGILAAYAANELPPEGRAALLPRLLECGRGGAAVLVIEPIARRGFPWWEDWTAAFIAAGGRAEEWRFDVRLPERQLHLARAAGLQPKGLTARSLCLNVQIGDDHRTQK